MQRQTTEFERSRVLQEKIACLGKEQTETPDIDLALIQRRVRKIRVGRDGACDGRRDLVESASAWTELKSGVPRIVPVTLISDRGIGLNIQTEACVNSGNPGQRSRSGNVRRRNRLHDGRPANALILAPDQAKQVEAPICVRLVIGDAAKGDDE